MVIFRGNRGHLYLQVVKALISKQDLVKIKLQLS